MKRRWWRVWLCLLLCVTVCFLPGCRNKQPTTGTPTNQVLTVGCSAFGGNYSPFFATVESDRLIVDLTQIRLLNVDRNGQVICDGINGETTEYQGTAYQYTGPASVTVTTAADGSVEYAFVLREDLTFSDGTPLTARDVVFSMYVLCDPTYTGSCTFASLPIKGLEEYRQNVVPKWKLILDETPAKATVGSEEGYYTVDEAIEFWTLFNEAGAEFAAEIVKDGIARGIGTDVRSVSEALGYGSLPEGATETDLFNRIVDTRGYTLSATGINTSAADHDFSTLLLARLNDSMKKGVITGNSAARISGIRQTGEYTLSVTLTQFDATALYQFCIPIAPLHHYGSVQQFSPESGSFGFSKGDLSGVESRSGTPLGAGAYVYSAYRENTVTLNANASYYRGAPTVSTLACRAVKDSEKLELLSAGSLQLTQTDMTVSLEEAVKKANGGVMSGDVVAVEIVQKSGYGYIGMNADRIRVGGASDSKASKQLRQALVTVFSAYREESVSAYYGSYGAVVTSPASVFEADSPGALVAAGDESVDRDALCSAVLACFQNAGYTVEGNRISAAPPGGSLSFSVCYAGGGNGTHPAKQLLTKSAELLSELGITLTLNDFTSEAKLLQAIATDQAEIWCSFRNAYPETDFYAWYASQSGCPDDVNINDETLDRLLLQARHEPDTAKRQALYREVFATVSAWAVEVPLYQKQTVLLMRTGDVNVDTLPQDTTAYYDWTREAELLQLTN